MLSSGPGATNPIGNAVVAATQGSGKKTTGSFKQDGEQIMMG